MKKNTIKWKIFNYNITAIMLLIILVAIIFNVAIRLYFEKDILKQLKKIESHTEDTALRKGPDFLKKPGENLPPPPPELEDYEKQSSANSSNSSNNELYRYYFMLDHSIREPLSMLNADYILLDNSKKRISPIHEEYSGTSTNIADKIIEEASKYTDSNDERYLNFHISNVEYIAVMKPVFSKNSFGLGYIIIYSSLEKVNQLQLVINAILFAILIMSALIVVIISSQLAKKVSEPFSSLNKHIGAIAERNFGNKIEMPVYDELQEFVDNINIMSEKLETYDKAQKTFLQNASHEFRTPLMSIQSYAEGIKYDVVDSKTASDIIIDETKRMTHLVEDLLYLSRLETIEENYHYVKLNFNELIQSCIERLCRIAEKNNVKIEENLLSKDIIILGDEEKLSRAITNIVSNCIRYAKSTVNISYNTLNNSKIQLTISDDGPGINESDLPNIFERFYKGNKGIFGLGLAISKNVIDKHGGKIRAESSGNGALFIIELPMSI